MTYFFIFYIYHFIARDVRWGSARRKQVIHDPIGSICRFSRIGRKVSGRLSATREAFRAVSDAISFPSSHYPAATEPLPRSELLVFDSDWLPVLRERFVFLPPRIATFPISGTLSSVIISDKLCYYYLAGNLRRNGYSVSLNTGSGPFV